jgi:hypothetical protein
MVMGIQHWSVITAEVLVGTMINIVYLKMVKDGRLSRTATIKNTISQE